MDKSKIFQPNQEYKLEDGILNVNTFNGRMLYSYPIESIGTGTFQIDASLIYNSLYSEANNKGVKFGFGNGWKFSFEECILRYDSSYDIEGFSILDYIYIDCNWCIHRFVKYKDCEGYDNPGSVYYDESGTGLKLIVSSNSNYKMFDEYGNTYYFDKASGKLITVVSGINSLIIKNIEYDEQKEKVISVYDSRKNDRKLKFEYNEKNLPIKVYSTNSKVYHTFEYDNNKLIRVYKENGKKKKMVHEFLYNNCLINYIINSENSKILMLEYENINTNPALNKVTFGVIKENHDTLSENSELYLGENSFVGENFYITNSGKKYQNEKNKISDQYIYSTISYEYMNGYTEVSNYKNIKMRHFFDTEGHNVGSLEFNDDKNQELHYYTASKPTGWNIDVNGNSNIYINGKKSKFIQRENNKYILSINNDSLSEFKEIFADESEKNSEHFTLSFWLMFDNCNNTNMLANLNFSLNNKNKVSQSIIKNTYGNVWQHVSIPFNLETYQESFNDLSLVFNVDEKLNTNNDLIYISDLRIDKGNSKTICIDNLKVNDESYMELEIGSKLYYYDDYEKEVTLSSDFYLTEADIIATFRSLFYSIVNEQVYYELFYCNKTKIKSVTYISMLPFFLTEDQSIRAEHKYYTFDFAYYNNNGERVSSDKPNYHFRLIDLISNNEEKKSYRVTEIQRKIKSRGNNRYNFETITLTGVVENNNSVLRLNENNSVSNVVEENDAGIQTANKYYKKILNDGIEKQICVENKKVYDSFGNIIKEINKVEDDTEEQLIKEYKYVENNPIENEYVSEIKENDHIISTLYSDNGNIESITIEYNKKYIDGIVYDVEKTVANHLKYFYDEYNNLTNVKFYDKDWVLIGENKVSYNNKGEVNKLSNKSEINYGFLYDSIGNVCDIYCNKKLIQKNMNNVSKINDEYTSYLYQGTHTYVTNNLYDKYGKILSSLVETYDTNGIVNRKRVLFEYENNEQNYSNSLVRVKKIIDPFANKEYYYDYDDSILAGTTSKMSINNSYFITERPNGAKEYEIVGDLEQIKYFVEQEDQMNKNPKYSYNYMKDNNTSEWKKKPQFSFNYEYDGLCRLISKRTEQYEHINENISIVKDINYYSNTNLPKEIKYKVESKIYPSDEYGETTELVYNNSYENGNIIKVRESGNGFVKNSNLLYDKIDLDSVTRNYFYDDNNRLIQENHSCGDIIIYSYGLKSGMIEKVSKNNIDNVVKTLSYNAGRLTKVDNNDIIYDNLGNIIGIGDNKMTYNSNNLMESYSNNDFRCLFEYNYQGFRTKKIKNNYYEVNYYLDGSRIIGEDIITYGSSKTKKLRYFYDASGVTGINYINNGQSYNYNFIKDSLGNVSKIMFNGRLICEYLYDGWGNCSTKLFNESNLTDNDIFIANNNPFRYKGYYRDTETGLYYCGARYYNPEIFQWLSPDDVEYLDMENISGLNLYCYCGNEPINRSDPFGNEWDWKKVLRCVGTIVVAAAAVAAIAVVTVASGGSAVPVLVGAAIGAAVSGGVSATMQFMTTGTVDVGQLVVDIAVGGVMGAFGGSALSRVGMAFASAGTEFLGSYAGNYVAGDPFDLEAACISAAAGLVLGFAGGPGAQNGKLSARVKTKKNLKLSEKKLKSGKFTQQQYAQSKTALKRNLENQTKKLVNSAIDEIYYGIYPSIISGIIGFPF